MAPALQRKHPEIATFGGRGIDDSGATIAADLSPLGFHASVRSPNGAGTSTRTSARTPTST